MSSPKILFVTRYHFLRSIGGAELQCWMLAGEFARRGWEVHYASEMNTIPEPNPLDGVTLHGLPENPHWISANKRELSELMQSLKPDVIYNRVYDSYTGISMCNAPQNTLTVWAAAANGEGPPGAALKRMWSETDLMRNLVRLPRRYVSLSRAYRGAQAAKLVIAQHGTQAKALSEFGIQAEVIRNSVLPVSESELQSHDGKPVVLWVGSLKPVKQPPLFYELARRCQDLDCDFVMAGGVQDESERTNLESARKTLKNFSYVGLISSNDIGDYYRRAHVLVCTSRTEGFPNTFPQAWLRGVPVVSLGIDPDFLLRDQKLGRAGDTMDELERALRELILSPDTRREIGKRAREFALREFDLKSNVDKMEALFAARGVKR